MKKLFLVNCCYYEKALMNGLFEMHVTLPVAATTGEEAKSLAKRDEFFVSRGIRAHVDGIACVEKVGEYKVEMSL